MKDKSVQKIVTELIEPYLEALGMELVHLEYRAGNRGSLTIYIDKPGGVTIGDCEKASKGISDLLDAYDPIPHRYMLEVSSPGVERPLVKRRDFERFLGEPVKISTIEPIDGAKKFTGMLAAVKGDFIELRMEDGQNIEVAFDNINKAHLRFTPPH
ncbi:MAG: ribosome maturation factor RimP [Firmicutes bacterium]|jgi:ribosome maturation factor RimP|nr:ribosome maturation factor RimP [Bacillota bacterium]